MAKGPFLPVARSILDHDLWKDKPFAKGQAWIDLLLLANYTDKTTRHRGQIVTCKRGDVNLSMLELADRWGWERKKVKRFLNVLEMDGMVTVNATTQRTTITIENYSIYNGYVDNETGNDRDNGRDNDRDNRTGITKKEKKEKKEKKDNKTIKSVLELAPPEMVPALRDFVEMRQTIKAPLTARALELLIGKVNKLSGGDIAKSIEILNQSTENGWKGVYEIKTSSEKPLNNYDKLAEWARGGD